MAMMDAAIRELLTRRAPRSVLVLGASGTGKTTLVEQLLTEWTALGPVAVVDGDVGQSHLGPPTTIAWGICERSFTGWSGIVVKQLAFIGNVSPEGVLEPFLDATARIVQQAKASGLRVVVDTTGLTHGQTGTSLKMRKLSLIRPDAVLALQHEGELEELLVNLPQDAVARMAVSPACIQRSLAERAAYRNRQFARYFVAATLQTLRVAEVSRVGLGSDWPTGEVALVPEGLIDRVVGLRTAHGEDLAIGTLRKLDLAAGTVTLLTPLRELASIRQVVVGSVRWPLEAVHEPNESDEHRPIRSG